MWVTIRSTNPRTKHYVRRTKEISCISYAGQTDQLFFCKPTARQTKMEQIGLHCHSYILDYEEILILSFFLLFIKFYTFNLYKKNQYHNVNMKVYLF